MNQELKQQAHKEFDKYSIKLEGKESPEIVDILQNISDIAFEKQKIEVYKLLDSLIDRTVQMTEERIVGVVKEKSYMNDYGDTIIEDIEELISLITNKSDENKEL